MSESNDFFEYVDDSRALLTLRIRDRIEELDGGTRPKFLGQRWFLARDADIVRESRIDQQPPNITRVGSRVPLQPAVSTWRIDPSDIDRVFGWVFFEVSERVIAQSIIFPDGDAIELGPLTGLRILHGSPLYQEVFTLNRTHQLDMRPIENREDFRRFMHTPDGGLAECDRVQLVKSDRIQTVRTLDGVRLVDSRGADDGVQEQATRFFGLLPLMTRVDSVTIG